MTTVQIVILIADALALGIGVGALVMSCGVLRRTRALRRRLDALNSRRDVQ